MKQEIKYTVFDPAMLFISENDWNIESVRDCFISNLNLNLSIINKYSFTKILWNDELSVLLFSHPQFPPWRVDKDWKNQIIPLLYRRLNDNIQLIPDATDYSCCDVIPNMFCINDRAFKLFLKIIHFSLIMNNDLLLCLSTENSKNSSSYSFSCTCHNHNFTPSVIKNPNEWFNYINYIDKLWPEKDENFFEFLEALEITKKLCFYDKKVIHEIDINSFSKLFIKDIIHTKKNRSKIIYNIISRLTSNNMEAAKNSSLQDEKINGKTNEFRFRVAPRPASTRIHYTFKNNRILFLRYYDDGHHDDGI